MDKKLKILIIDDEEDFFYFTKLNLEKTGRFDVTGSTKGPEGIGLAKKNKPDLILLDILMPEMDGPQVARHLLEDTTTSNIPIVFLTALANKEDIETGKGLIGGRPFIAKPVTSAELISRIESILGI